MTTSNCPPFAEALDRFRTFLVGLGLNSDLRWIFREDVVERGRRTYIRCPLPNDLTTVETLYERGLRHGLGIHLSVFCILAGNPCCYVWLPKDEEDASYRMLSGLKLSGPPMSDRRKVIAVTSRIRWGWLKWREWSPPGASWADQIPCRDGLAEIIGNGNG